MNCLEISNRFYYYPTLNTFGFLLNDGFVEKPQRTGCFSLASFYNWTTYQLYQICNYLKGDVKIIVNRHLKSELPVRISLARIYTIRVVLIFIGLHFLLYYFLHHNQMRKHPWQMLLTLFVRTSVKYWHCRTARFLGAYPHALF